MARHRILLAIAAAIVSALSLGVPAAAADRAIQQTPTEPPGTSCRVIDFESAKVVRSSTVPAQYVLLVSGEKPYLNMQIELVPLIYIRQPEYWGIEVVGCLPEIGLPAIGRYEVKLDITGTIGTRGIEVIGASRSEKIDIPRNQIWPRKAG